MKSSSGKVTSGSSDASITVSVETNGDLEKLVEDFFPWWRILCFGE